MRYNKCCYAAKPPSYDELYREYRDVRDPRTFASFAAKVFSFIIGTGE